jgi:hypothetical protein
LTTQWRSVPFCFPAGAEKLRVAQLFYLEWLSNEGTIMYESELNLTVTLLINKMLHFSGRKLFHEFSIVIFILCAASAVRKITLAIFQRDVSFGAVLCSLPFMKWYKYSEHHHLIYSFAFVYLSQAFPSYVSDLQAEACFWLSKILTWKHVRNIF